MVRLADLILESDVYDRFPGLFVTDELRMARQRGEVAFYPRGRAIYYTEGDLVAYVQSKKVVPQCRDNKPLDESRPVPRELTSTPASGLVASVIAMSGRTTGTMKPLDERAARQLENEI